MDSCRDNPISHVQNGRLQDGTSWAVPYIPPSRFAVGCFLSSPASFTVALTVVRWLNFPIVFLQTNQITYVCLSDAGCICYTLSLLNTSNPPGLIAHSLQAHYPRSRRPSVCTQHAWSWAAGWIRWPLEVFAKLKLLYDSMFMSGNHFLVTSF